MGLESTRFGFLPSYPAFRILFQHMNSSKDKLPISRRRLLGGTAAAAAASLNIIPSRLLGQDSPSNTLNIAFIGAGGRAGGNLAGVSSTGQNIYALCDVDKNRCGGAIKKFPNAKFFTDYREMLEVEGDNIDAVVISTPDHTHAVAAMAAMKLDKHVYVEKPLTVTISEARALHAEAKKRGLCTQMGNTGHASNGSRLTNEFIRSGSIGDIKEIHCRTNRPIWPQDIIRPDATKAPEWLDWDKWLGPAKKKPYGVYMEERKNKNGKTSMIPKPIAPFNWRGYLEYGTGALGDMGAHIIDHPVWALGLGLPTKIEVEKADRFTPRSEHDTHPQSCIIHYTFKGPQGPVHLTWFDGRYKIPKVDGMSKGTPDNGCLYKGSKHTMIHKSHGGDPEIVGPNRASFVKPPETEERSPGHYAEWIEAIKSKDPAKAKSNFDVAAPLTETLLLGVIGSVIGAGTDFTWDADKMTTGNAEADKWVKHNYRDGWSL